VVDKELLKERVAQIKKELFAEIKETAAEAYREQTLQMMQSSSSSSSSSLDMKKMMAMKGQKT
jgi:hypothetical protein